MKRKTRKQIIAIKSKQKIRVLIPFPDGKVVMIGTANSHKEAKKLGERFHRFPKNMTVKEAVKRLRKNG